MTTRRQVLALAGSALSLLAASSGTRAARNGPAGSRLATRMFNFRDDVASGAADSMVAKLKELRALPGVAGFMVGRNLSPTLFATRFEWIYLIQFDARTEMMDPAHRQFDHLRAELAALCRNQVECDLQGDFPARYADAPGVTVRHTVMFDFKPDAPPEAQERIVTAIRRMGTLPMVQHYRIDRSAAPAPDPDQMQWQVTGDFASLADYQAYSDAPVHLAIRDDFTTHTSRVAFLDTKV